MSIVTGAGGLPVLNTAARDGVVGPGSDQYYGFEQGIAADSVVPPSDYHTFDLTDAAAGTIPVEIVSMSPTSGHNNVDNPVPYESIVESPNAANTLIHSATFTSSFGLGTLAPSGVIPVNLTVACLDELIIRSV